MIAAECLAANPTGPQSTIDLHDFGASRVPNRRSDRPKSTVTDTGITEITNENGTYSGYDPTWSTLTVAVSYNGNQMQTGEMTFTFAATGVTVGDAPPVPEASNTALLLLTTSGSLFLLSRRRFMLRVNPMRRTASARQ